MKKSTKSDTVFSALTSAPEVRAAMRAHLDSEMAPLRARLAELEAAAVSLGDETPAKRKPGRPRKDSVPAKPVASKKPRKARKSRAGRPPGAVKDHGGAIKDVLAGQAGGLSAGEIWEALVARNHDAQKKTIMTYLSKMGTNGSLTVSGDRGSFRYAVEAAPEVAQEVAAPTDSVS